MILNLFDMTHITDNQITNLFLTTMPIYFEVLNL